VADLRVIIPGVPPSLNKLSISGNRVYRDGAWGDWKTDAVLLIREAKRLQKWAVPTGKPILRIKIMWYRPDRRRRDSDNVVKCIGDAVATALETDDCNFEYTTHRGYSKDDPGVAVMIGVDTFSARWRGEVFRQFTEGK